MLDKESGQMMSAVDLYFMCQDGSMFKARVPYAPYFYVVIRDDQEVEVEGWLRRKFEGSIKDVQIMFREDLDMVRRAQRASSADPSMFFT